MISGRFLNLAYENLKTKKINSGTQNHHLLNLEHSRENRWETVLAPWTAGSAQLASGLVCGIRE